MHAYVCFMLGERGFCPPLQEKGLCPAAGSGGDEGILSRGDFVWKPLDVGLLSLPVQ